jgi:hypothetical protein
MEGTRHIIGCLADKPSLALVRLVDRTSEDGGRKAFSSSRALGGTTLKVEAIKEAVTIIPVVDEAF